MLAGNLFPWRCIWSTYVPKKVSIFVWAGMLNNTLTIDKLVKRGIPLINWCGMCKANNESVCHLLLHSAAAHNLWSFVFRLLGCSG